MESGISVVVAAGNDGQRRLLPPATAPMVLTIGGIDDGNTVGQSAEDSLALKQIGRPLSLVRKGSVGVDRVKTLRAKEINRPCQAVNANRIALSLQICRLPASPLGDLFPRM